MFLKFLPSGEGLESITLRMSAALCQGHRVLTRDVGGVAGPWCLGEALRVSAALQTLLLEGLFPSLMPQTFSGLRLLARPITPARDFAACKVPVVYQALEGTLCVHSWVFSTALERRDLEFHFTKQEVNV